MRSKVQILAKPIMCSGQENRAITTWCCFAISEVRHGELAQMEPIHSPVYKGLISEPTYEFFHGSWHRAFGQTRAICCVDLETRPDVKKQEADSTPRKKSQTSYTSVHK